MLATMTAFPVEATVPVVLRTEIPEFTLLSRGKVRDVYDLGSNLLIVATDRISAFDYVLGTGIPDKGKVLNLLSVFWFERFRELVPSHLVSVDVRDFPSPASRYAGVLEGRSTLARKCTMFPVECVVRGYLAGSGYKEYLATGAVSGIRLRPGLRDSDRIPEPIFTPATKAETGHDENISFDTMVSIVGAESAENLRRLSLKIYTEAARHAEERGILLADTKFEFGTLAGKLVLCDEVLTPDSSRFWPRDEYRPGGSQKSYDKQFVRDYLERIGWNKQPPAPDLPEDIVRGTSERYREAYRVLTGRPLP
jgi:phosphoribosylaminoimidazole-succinocarboxamide synthase